MEITTQSMEKIKTLLEKKKTYAPLMGFTNESMKKERKKIKYLIQSTQAIIKGTYMRSLAMG